MKLRNSILLLAAIACITAASAQPTDKAAVYMRRLADTMKAMEAYTVEFKAVAGDESIRGRYEVDGHRYHIAVAGNEVYGDDVLRREIDAAHREIVVDLADTTSHNLLTNPVRGFRFLGDDYRPRLDSESDGCAVVTLMPAERGAANRIIVTLGISDAMPRQICYDAEGEIVTIVIESIARGASVPAFDAADYPDYEIIDFR